MTDLRLVDECETQLPFELVLQDGVVMARQILIC